MQRDKELAGGVREERGCRLKTTEMWYVHLPVTHQECNHYVLKIGTKKNKNLKRQIAREGLL